MNIMLFLAVFRLGLGIIIVFYHIKVWVENTSNTKTRASRRPSIASRETEPAAVASKPPKELGAFTNKMPLEGAPENSASQIPKAPDNPPQSQEHPSEAPGHPSEAPRQLSIPPESEGDRPCQLPPEPEHTGFEGTPMSKTGSYLLDEIAMKFDDDGIEIVPKSPPRLPKQKKR